MSIHVFHLNLKINLKNHPKVHLIDAPVVEISSTFIRNNIKEEKYSALLPV
jgi:nicotinic acid mononucleotide adenylyltransferase